MALQLRKLSTFSCLQRNFSDSSCISAAMVTSLFPASYLTVEREMGSRFQSFMYLSESIRNWLSVVWVLKLIVVLNS